MSEQIQCPIQNIRGYANCKGPNEEAGGILICPNSNPTCEMSLINIMAGAAPGSHFEDTPLPPAQDNK